MEFHNKLTRWYLQNKRDLPWRNTTDPYKIWLSEIILQQTRVAQGLPYFNSFITTFPSVFDLANASEQEVLKLWQGLGYYSRARNLHATAKIVVENLNGVFPNNYKALLLLKGVGEYTAAAIASFSYNESIAVVDGNVFRVLSRYFGIDADISLPKTKKEFSSLANELIPNNTPALFNQAIMEFGALQCIPKSPNCTICPLNDSCKALQLKKVNELPIKTKKIIAKKRYFNYLIFEDKSGNTLIQKRTENDIWMNLYEFPMIETKLQISESELISLLIDQYQTKTFSISLIHSPKKPHKLTHQHLWIQFWKVSISDQLPNSIPISELNSYPYPIVIHQFIEDYILSFKSND